MVKPAGPGVYSATYSNIPVYEFQFGEGLKEHVMRRRGDDWINATHILKAAGFDKPARTRILEREVQKETHEKVQGGYGKYQGTWVPLEQGEALAQRNNIYEKLRTIFEFTPGNVSPPPAPKHTTAKPKVPKRPAVPKFHSKPVAAPVRVEQDYDNISTQLNDDESMADDMTVASASFMGEEDQFEMSNQSTGHRKRKREEQAQSAHERAHVMYSDELLDYFMLVHNPNTHSVAPKPEPPINFNPDWIIDTDGHTALHWAAAMGDVEVIRELKRFGANLAAQNNRGETCLMRSVLFVNCMDKQTMPGVVKELSETIDLVDYCDATVLHHAAAITLASNKQAVARYYLDVILNKLQEVAEPERVQHILDQRDIDGNTAIHIAAKHGARKCVRALIGRGARTNILNHKGITAERMIQEMNESRKIERRPQASSSPYGPESRFIEEMPEEPRTNIHHVSEAAMSIQSKVTPQMMEKFTALAESFDEELEEKDTLEREARRILTITIEESNATNSQVRDLSYQRETPDEKLRGDDHYASSRKNIISTVEQQQKIQLWAQCQLVESKANGHAIVNDDDVAERIMLAKLLDQEQSKRQKLMGNFIDARSMAGGGEQIATYRDVLIKAVGPDMLKILEEDPDAVLTYISEEAHGLQSETIKV